MKKFSKGGDVEDFEFKPLTEGLGFHKKKIELRDELAAQMQTVPTGDIMPKPKHSPPLFNMSSQKSTGAAAPTPGSQPLQKQPLVPKPLSPPKASWQPAISNVDIEESDGEFKPTATGWAAGFFDAMMVLGIGLIFTAAVFAVTGIDFEELSTMLSTEFGAQLAMAFLLFAVLELYGVSSRVLFGATLGEWAFGLRMGTEDDQRSVLFPIKLTWRIFITAITGFVLLPLLSMILETDVAGKLSGLELYSEEV